MRRSITSILLAFAFICSTPLIAEAQTKEEAYARELTGEITAALEAGDAAEVLALVSAYERLGIKVPGEVLIAKGQAYLIEDNLPAAQTAYKKALADPGLDAVDRVRSQEMVRKIDGTLAAVAERKASLKRLAEAKLASALENPARLVREASLDELSDLFEGLSVKQSNELWDQLNSINDDPARSADVFRWSYRDERSSDVQFKRNFAGNRFLFNTARLQFKVFCETERDARERFYSTVLAIPGGGLSERLKLWLRYPAVLPSECWYSWNELMVQLSIPPEYLIHHDAKDAPSMKFVGQYIGYIYHPLAIARIDGQVQVGSSPAAFMFRDYLNDQGYSDSKTSGAFSAAYTNDDFTTRYQARARFSGTSSSLQLFSVFAGPHSEMFQAREPDYLTILEDYGRVIRDFAEHNPQSLERLKLMPCSRNGREVPNILFWRAIQLEGYKVSKMIPADCFLGTYDFYERINNFQNGQLRGLKTVKRTYAGLPKLSRMLSPDHSEAFNDIIADFLIESGIGLSVSWENREKFPLLYAAETGQCSIYQKLKAAGAQDFGNRARRVIRKIDRGCK